MEIERDDAKSKFSYGSPNDPLLKKLAIWLIEKFSKKQKVVDLYQHLIDNLESNDRFWEEAVAHLQLTIDYDATELAKVPTEGPVLFVVNHPFGIIDGLIACTLAIKSRQSFKILINDAIISREERIKPYMLPISFARTREAALINLNSRNEAIKLLKQGGTVIVFPAGTVATAVSFFGPVKEIDWKVFTAKIIYKSQPTVVPIYVHGQNSRLYQIISQFSHNLRQALTLREMSRKIGHTIPVKIGDPIPYEQLAHLKDRQQLVSHLQAITLGLADRLNKIN